MKRVAVALAVAFCMPACAETQPAPRPETVATAGGAPAAEPRPGPRPARTAPTVQPPLARPDRPTATLCGDARLEGRALAPIKGPGPCGIAGPVRLRRVAGVALEPPADLGCKAAIALADWIANDLQPVAVLHAGARVARLRVAASYVCKRVNGQRKGRLSQHALGNAIDISAFTLSDGRRITVTDGWRGSDQAFTRAAWRTACGPFGTVLGPAADRFHQHHFHIDVASYPGGPYCR